MILCFVLQAVLGSSAVKEERNLVQVETKDFDNKDLKQPLFSLTLGKDDMVSENTLLQARIYKRIYLNAALA